MILIGIDPGAETGLATWSVQKQELIDVESCTHFEAMTEIKARSLLSQEIFVFVEDSRKRGGPPEAAQGAGAVKSKCTDWEKFLKKHKIKHIMKRPGKNIFKNDASGFNRTTGWKGRTNSHGRDAAMLVYGVNNVRLLQGMMR